MNPVKVAEAMHEAIDRANGDFRPTFLEMKPIVTEDTRCRTRNCTVLRKRSKNTKNDPITQVLEVIKDQKYATDAEVEAIDERVKNLVEECATFAEDSAFPEIQQLYDVVYEQENYPFIPHKL
jgi:pyruvate dehydrogenase E1 component alpha subunit